MQEHVRAERDEGQSEQSTSDDCCYFHINFSFLGCFVSGEDSKSYGFQNDLAARMAALAQFMSTPGFRQGKDGFYNWLHFAVFD
jgi:hypothetical protein